MKVWRLEYADGRVFTVAAACEADACERAGRIRGESGARPLSVLRVA